MKTLKIGRKEVEVKNGDYIQDNGASLLFFSGDGRILKQEGFNSYNYLYISKALAKKEMVNLPVSYHSGFGGIKLKRYTY